MNIFVEIGLIIFIATAISIVMRLLKQPLIVGYILSGIIVGPYLLNLVESASYIELFSKFGIAILLFIIGLNLKPDIIREVGKASLVVGLGQIIFTSIVGFLILQLLGFSFYPSLLGAIALTFSSTIIILKLISDKNDLDKLYAKISIGMLLVQDVAAAFILLILSASKNSVSSNGVSVSNIFPLLIKGIAFFVLLYLISKYLLPKLLNFLTRSHELLFLFSISWGIGLAALFHALGFSLEIGALAAGIAFAASPFSQEVGSRLKPLRDFFILLFFVMLGSQIILSNLGGVILPAIILSLFVLIGNPFIVFVIMNLLGYKKRTSFLTGLTVAQISEFSLILVALGFSLGYLDREFTSLITLVGIITIAGSTYFIIYADNIYLKLRKFLCFFEFRKSKIKQEGTENKLIDLFIFGCDRVGYEFVNVAKRMNKNYLVVDFNPNLIPKFKKHQIPFLFGDADDIDFLEDIGIIKAGMIVSTIPDFKTNLELISYYRTHNQNGIIIVISHTIENTKEFYAQGASFVIMSHHLGAKHASKMVEMHYAEPNTFQIEKEQHLEYLKEREKFAE